MGKVEKKGVFLQLCSAAIARDETATNAESIALLTVVSTAQATTFVDNPVLCVPIATPLYCSDPVGLLCTHTRY